MNPLFNDNKFKLATFGTNVSGGCAISTIDGVFETTWPNVLKLARMADRAGFEGIVPVARWRGFGGVTEFNGTCFETYTWAAGLAQATNYSAVFATSHVPTIHPIVAAKQGTTIDHISGGRFALNIVCGWFTPELEMFGAPIMEHDTRYEYAAEWLAIVRRLWTEREEWDHQGRFFKVARGFHEPKPVQHPCPPVMNAGGSGAGRHFAAKYCDMAFTRMKGHEDAAVKAAIDDIRDLARDEYKRDLQVWANSYCVIGDTEADARKFLDYYVREKGDWVAADNLTRINNIQTQSLPAAAVEKFKYHFIAGFGGYPFVGTPQQIADQMVNLSRMGMDGVVLSWPRYEEGLARFIAEVVPLLEQAGLRRPFVSPHAAAAAE